MAEFGWRRGRPWPMRVGRASGRSSASTIAVTARARAHPASASSPPTVAGVVLN